MKYIHIVSLQAKATVCGKSLKGRLIFNKDAVMALDVKPDLCPKCAKAKQNKQLAL